MITRETNRQKRRAGRAVNKLEAQIFKSVIFVSRFRFVPINRID